MNTRTRPRLVLGIFALVTGIAGATLASSGPPAAALVGGSVTIQTMDSCKGLLGGATYEIYGGGIFVSVTTPSGNGSLPSPTCPLPQGNCVSSSVGCATFADIPPGSYLIKTIQTPPPNTTNPEGYAPCEGGSACQGEAARVIVSATGGVTTTVANLYPDGSKTTLNFAGTPADPVVFHDFGLAAPGANGNRQCDGDSDADDHSTGTPSSNCGFAPESAEATACQPFPWSCTLAPVTAANAPSTPAVTPTGPHQLSITTQGPSAAFQPVSVTVAALTGGVPDPTYTGTVSLALVNPGASPLAALPAPYTFTAADAGSHTFTVVFGRTGVQALSATDQSSTAPFPAGTASMSITGDDASFVENLYHDILTRLGSVDEVNYWLSQMAAGMGRGAVAHTFATSQELYGRMVDADYQTMFSRTPDPAGRAYWVSQLTAGAYDETVLADLAASPEYYYGHGQGNDRGFITALYQDILGRTPTSSEVDGWIAGGRPPGGGATVAADFAFSHEHHLQVISGLYPYLLGRPADPSGAAYWATLLDNGARDEDGIAFFSASDEYFNKPSAY